MKPGFCGQHKQYQEHRDVIKRTRPPQATLQLVVFGLISLPPVFLYLAASSGAVGWTWVLLALVVAGNLLAIAIY